MATQAPQTTALVPHTAVPKAATPVVKFYHNAVPNSTFIMPDGTVHRFLGHTLSTDDPALQAELDKIIGKAGIMRGVENKRSELTADTAAAAAGVAQQAQADTAAAAKELAAKLAGGGSPLVG